MIGMSNQRASHLRRESATLIAAAALSCIVVAGCASTGTGDRKSVKPGINDKYRDPELNVKEWVARFEGESREIYACRHKVISTLDFARGDTVLDVGAGTGLFEPLLANRVGPQGRVVAIDITPKFVEHIQERARVSGLHQVTARLCSEDSIDTPTATADVVFTCDTYHHFEYPSATLASIHDALKPGGIFYVIDFERIPGVSREWLLEHVRAGKATVIEEITAAGFEFEKEIPLDCLKENYVLRFKRR